MGIGRCLGQKRFKVFKILLATFVVLLLLLAHCSPGLAQREAELSNPSAPIPKSAPSGRPFKSWSLFLVSNPEWLLPENNEKLEELHVRFKAFGAAIGPEHLAVWFWSKRPETTDRLFTAVDVLRSSAFCQRLKLKPSEGPYIVLTTQFPGKADLDKYPETFPERLDSYYVVALNGSGAAESMVILNKLADQLVAGDIRKLDPASESYWRGWQKSFEAVRTQLVGFSKKVNVTFKTAFFSTVVSL